MTARSTRTGEDAEELDVEEVLRLVNEHGGRTPAGDPGGRTPEVPSPGGQRAHSSDAHHRATPWHEARTIAARAARAAVRAAGRAPVSVALDSALGLTLATPLAALNEMG